jgi:hypothetical protein
LILQASHVPITTWVFHKQIAPKVTIKQQRQKQAALTPQQERQQ